MRTRPLRREVTRACSATGAFMVLNPVAPPRLWRWITDEVGAAFERTVEGHAPSTELLEAALRACADAVGKIRAQLIEPELTVDAQVGVLVVAQGIIHAALSSGTRLYRARGGVPERLWTQVKRPPGVASRAVRPSSETTSPGDLFVLGTRDTFTVRAIANLASCLSRAPRAPVAELCDAVVSPCRESGIGSAAFVVRAR